MFKAILPSSKRISSSEFTMVTSPGDPLSGKENLPDNHVITPAQTKSGKGTHKGNSKQEKMKTVKVSQDLVVEPVVMNQAFDKLLDELQIPSTVRVKLAGMDATVKAAMLKSSHVITSNPTSGPPSTPMTLRKARSSESVGSPLPPSMSYDQMPTKGSWISGLSGKSTTDLHALDDRQGHDRGLSVDGTRTFSQGQNSPVISGDLITSKSKEKGFVKNITPVKLCSILASTSSTQLEVEVVKKLRLFLRNESAIWSEDFLKLGGYNAMLTRLNEILEVEWREEQHDDQILYELLRCFKALSTSAIGCFALRSSCPTPFVQLVSLLYSDKKPGDVATRQLIVELLLILFELYPSSSLPSTGNRSRREAWEPEGRSSSNLITFPAPHKNFYSLIRALLLTPAPPATESPASPVSPHAFIESLHRPRIYKTYLQELSDVCRDYFWVFCHPNNTVWNLEEVDEGKVEKPKAPGGMTGGVEFEAMGYFTMHLKLLNAIAKSVHELNLPKEHDMSAHRFHSDLFASGFERIILISRKTSVTYYPTLHLELSRYIAWAGAAKFELPWTVSRLIGAPPLALAKLIAGQQQRPTRQGQVSQGTPTRRPPGFVGLPSPKKVEPIKFE
ncbi:armadillo-type protein [Suillus plorans]|uniref:Armadillo-type protein n=1 Tax=Suillus plorans TaxID=116603 RepID=A0A9P7DWE2_9AGAM|nr:armadillo-type protein [Suillus plorans]KAG1804946.1 armadillo-type protein [Suillus plorans]